VLTTLQFNCSRVAISGVAICQIREVQVSINWSNYLHRTPSQNAEEPNQPIQPNQHLSNRMSHTHMPDAIRDPPKHKHAHNPHTATTKKKHGTTFGAFLEQAKQQTAASPAKQKALQVVLYGFAGLVMMGVVVVLCFHFRNVEREAVGGKWKQYLTTALVVIGRRLIVSRRVSWGGGCTTRVRAGRGSYQGNLGNSVSIGLVSP
jgi:hypothetical protein